MGTSVVHYVVRNAEGQSLTDLGRVQKAWHWRWHSDDLTRMLCRIPSRAEAERLAAEHGGTVHRITVTDEAVGPLTWKTRETGASIYDGDEWIGQAFLMLSGFLRGRWHWRVAGVTGNAATLDEAKAAAEKAVRETWT